MDEIINTYSKLYSLLADLSKLLKEAVSTYKYSITFQGSLLYVVVIDSTLQISPESLIACVTTPSFVVRSNVALTQETIDIIVKTLETY